MRRRSFSEAINARRKFPSRVEHDRQRGVNRCDHKKRPKPPAQAAAGVMPDPSGDDARECHRQHEFPGEIHDLIDPRARERSTDPDVNEQQRAQFCEKPDVGRKEVNSAPGRMPPSIENVLLLPQPAMKTANYVVDPTPKKKRTPASIVNGVMFRPYGMIPSARMAAAAMRTGARKCTILSARAGTISSLINILMPSAIGWKRPNGPTRFGP